MTNNDSLEAMPIDGDGQPNIGGGALQLKFTSYNQNIVL